ncbi:MAG TPA: GH92 family glycosyl hydrolase, partial [Opitutales bacterium]|nr:GH92 family glycosyl hydrolase [Opitutales bacterium]
MIRYKKKHLIFVCTLIAAICDGHAMENLAPMAKLEGNGENLQSLTNGIKGSNAENEYYVQGKFRIWGSFAAPEITIKWAEPQTINKVVLYDRASLENHLGACSLKFSDDSEVQVWAIPNDGSAKTVVFEPRTVTSMTLTGVDAVGLQVGLSEIEIYHDPDAKPHVRKRELSDLVSHVDPTIETSRGRWFYCTPGSRPFGMISAGAYTRNKNQWGGGYNYNSTDILGFAQIRNWLMSGVNIMPVNGRINPNLGEQGWKSHFSHATEVIEPGYHKLFLDRYQTQVEYTSTDRVAFYRLTHKDPVDPKILLSLGGWLGNVSLVDGRAQLVGPNRIEGSHGMTDRGWGGTMLSHVYFVIETSRPVTRMDGWKGAGDQLQNIRSFANPLPEGRLINGKGRMLAKYMLRNLPEEQAGVALAYEAEDGDELLIKIGISYTSMENARNNLETECAHWDFDQVRRDSRAIWNEELGRIQVTGGAEDTRVKFYTDLWHVLLGRHKINDISGDYPCYMSQPDENGLVPLTVRRLPLDAEGAPLFDHYNSDAWWLTMWNLNILWGLAWPERQDDFSASMMEYAKNGGKLPRGPSAGSYTYIMTGNPATSFLTSTFQKGLMTKVAPRRAFEQMKKDHLPGGMMEVDALYLENGWTTSAGRTLQWAFEDWALAQMAEDLGLQEDAAYFQKRSTGWRALLHPEVGLIMPKKEDGSWSYTNPLYGHYWVEANSWQATFSVSHDIPALAEMMGGNDALIAKLNHAFEQGADSNFVFGYSRGYVSYANQPGCSNAHVFSHA